MKIQHHSTFIKSLFTLVFVILAGCGSGSSESLNNVDATAETDNGNSTFPIFEESNVLISPSVTPSGNISDATPTFTWNVIQGATEYQYGHEDITTDEDTWLSYFFLAKSLNCSTTCSHTPTDYTFTVGEERAWWVRSKINNVWTEWSNPRTFKIIGDVTTTVSSAITPRGDITDTSPEFTWSAVQDAPEYQLGHENLDTLAWQQYDVTKEQATCLTIDQSCTFTPPNLTFEVNQRIAWWVRAKLDGVWGEWSVVSKFKIIPETNPDLIPQQISPSGEINTRSPIFSWTPILGATEYVLGHSEKGTGANWQQYPITLDQASCQNLNQNCQYSLPENTFSSGDNIEWWVRSLVGGILQEWSEGKSFKVLELQTQLDVKISEVLAVNTRTNLDPDFFQFSDWIELYNPTTQNIDLSNFGLSDDDEDPLQWQFPEGTIIQANSYLLVWADDENTAAKALHTNFKLSSKGEKLTLANANGTIIDSIDFDKQESDISTTKQLNEIVFMTPTPGAQNGITYASKDLSKTPLFSFNSGFFNNAITLTLTQENEADIYYTTDGSSPDRESTKYTQAINIDQTSVIRAISIESNALLPSKIISNSYFINHTSNLPVVSLTIDPEYLFDPKTGIYTEGDGSNGVPLNQCDLSFTQPFNFAQEWERPSHIEYFGINRVSEFSLTSGISISGQCSRLNQKKSFSFELDSKYGTKELEYKLFDSKNVEEFKDFKLRTGQFGYELSDIIGASLTHTSNLNIDYQAFTATQVFLNGEYWGVYNFREKKGSEYIEANYPDIDKDDLDIINQGFEAKTGDTDDYFALEILLNTTLGLDLSDDADYQQIIGLIDESNYIDYMALMIYSANTDWIGSNQRSWKEKKAGAKWRWMIDDLDSGFFFEDVNINQFTNVLQSSSTDVMVSLFKALTKNSTFNQKFKARFNTLLDTTFSPANMLNQINTIAAERSAYIPLENAVWSSITFDSFEGHVTNLKTFANSRSAIVKDQLNILIP